MADDENKSDVVIENFYLIPEILFHLVQVQWEDMHG